MRLLPRQCLFGALVWALCIVNGVALAAPATSILFVGNSFTYGYGSAVRFYRASTVTDLNGEGLGGMPALFKVFTLQAGLDYEVALETHPGIGLDWHLQNKRTVLTQRGWDHLVVHGYSTLDAQSPGDPALLVRSAQDLVSTVREKTPKVAVHLLVTWPRADQIYEIHGPWYGKSVEAMAHDLRVAYNDAHQAIPDLQPVIPVGEACVRAMVVGLAQDNPYHGTDAGKVDLWSYDPYHASTYGYYLEALTVFGAVTGLDPRTLGDSECAAFELGLSRTQAAALQQIAFDQLIVDHQVKASPVATAPSSHAHAKSAPEPKPCPTL